MNIFNSRSLMLVDAEQGRDRPRRAAVTLRRVVARLTVALRRVRRRLAGRQPIRY